MDDGEAQRLLQRPIIGAMERFCNTELVVWHQQDEHANETFLGLAALCDAKVTKKRSNVQTFKRLIAP